MLAQQATGKCLTMLKDVLNAIPKIMVKFLKNDWFEPPYQTSEHYPDGFSDSTLRSLVE